MKTVRYLRHMFALVDSDSPDGVDICCLDKMGIEGRMEVTDKPSVDALHCKIFTRLRSIDSVTQTRSRRRRAELARCRPPACVQLARRGCRAPGRWQTYALASPLVKRHDVDGNDKRIISGSLSGMIRVGDTVEACRVLKELGSRRDCVFMPTILAMDDVIISDHLLSARR